MTRSTGTSGLIFLASPPSLPMASRMAARSTTAGTPVKSCISTRARAEVDLLDRLAAVLQPVGEGCDVGLLDRGAVLVAQQVFQQHAQREGQAAEVTDLLLDRLEAEIGVAPAADLQRLAGLEAVGMGGGHDDTPDDRSRAGGWQNRGRERHRQSADAGAGPLCQIALMQLKMARILAAFALLVIVSGEASAQRNAVEAWDPSAREFGRLPVEPGLHVRRQEFDPRGAEQDPGERQALGFRPVDLPQHPRLPAQSRGPPDRQPEGHRPDGQGPARHLEPRAVEHAAGAGRRRRSCSGAAHARQRAAAEAGRFLAGDGPGAASTCSSPISRRRLPCSTRRWPARRRPPTGVRRSTIAATPISISASMAQAADDFDATLAGRTTFRARLGPLLWRYAAQVRARRDARGLLAKEVGNENLGEWPAPIAKFLLGKMSAGELEVAAETDEAAKPHQRQVRRRLLHGHRRHPPRRQAARPRTAPARRRPAARPCRS